ncbi:MAG TPA: polyprenyl synthetase family protein [Pilimelia sp.]|nr:polyprenyl synthetase family protein [Pilimelia sp.]
MTATPERRIGPPVLAHTGELVLPALRAAVDRLDPTNRAIASYHLGWPDGGGTPVAGSGGKWIRPTLALLSARACGAAAAEAVPAAVAVELVHNFSLVHDDVIDRDTVRRHRPTVWAVWGDADAILVGDAMLSLATEVVLDSGGPGRAEAARLLATAIRRLIAGESLDVAFERRADVSLAECLAMVGDKTGALLSASAALGAVLVGGPSTTVRALSAYGAELGLAFQLVDDLLGIWGDPARTGKPVASDLRSRKKTLPVTWAIHHGGAAGRELGRRLADPDSDPADLADLVTRAGGRAWATAEAGRRLTAAEAALATAAVPTDVAAHLGALARFVCDRDR